jgi:hypothetical protein
VLKTNLEGEEVAEATEDIVAQVAVAVVVAVAISIKTKGVVEIEVLNCRAI